MQPFFRDIADHAVRVSEQVQGFDDLLTSVLNANLAQVSVQQNEDMRRISAWVAIAAVPTAIAGIYGMNFDHMPELRWQFGYPAVLGADGRHLPRPLPRLQAQPLAVNSASTAGSDGLARMSAIH
jgi:magnesium transporter